MTTIQSRPQFPRAIGRSMIVVVALAVTIASVACDKASPTGPGGSGVNISAVHPDLISPSAAPQSFTLDGVGFLPGLTLRVVAPGGGVQSLSGTGVEIVSTMSVRSQAIFETAGTYVFVVQNQNASPSSPFSLVVRVPGSTAPQITSINPSTVSVGSSLQLLTVIGANFETGLTVHVTAPDGSIVVLVGSDISTVTATSFVMSYAFSQAGLYQVQVFSAGGEASNSMTVSALP